MTATLSFNTLVGALDQAVTETLETMFFAEAQLGAPDAPDSEVLRMQVAFSGDETGTLEMAISTGTARELAGNFLGLSTSEVSASDLQSVCGELANMICGAMVSLACPDGHFDLMAPCLLPPGAGPLTGTIARKFAVDSAGLLEVGVDCRLFSEEGGSR